MASQVDREDIMVEFGLSVVGTVYAIDDLRGRAEMDRASRMLGDLVVSLRLRLYKECGLLVPRVHFGDNLDLPKTQVLVSYRGGVVYDGDMRDCLGDYVGVMGADIKYPVWCQRVVSAIRKYVLEEFVSNKVCGRRDNPDCARSFEARRPHAFR